MRIYSFLSFCFVIGLGALWAQAPSSAGQKELDLPTIMKGYDWIGKSPQGVFWSEDSKHLYFRWNPDNTPGDSLYRISLPNTQIDKVSRADRKALLPRSGAYNLERSRKVFAKNGDLYLLDLPTGEQTPITKTIARESQPQFSIDEGSVFYQKNNNIFQWHIEEGWTEQLTDFRVGNKPPKGRGLAGGAQREWVQQEELNLIGILRERKEAEEAEDAVMEEEREERMKRFYYGSRTMQQLQISPDGQFVSFRLRSFAQGAEYTSVPDYIRESGYTDDLRARPKVGSPQDTYEFAVYNRSKDTVYMVDTESIPGIHDRPAYLADYREAEDTTEGPLRKVMILGPIWSRDSRHAVVVVRSLDFKDRWIMVLDPNTGQLRNLDRQHDDAWIDGPGISRWIGSQEAIGWMPDQRRIWFQSEASGFSHLYAVDVITGEKESLTSGTFEVFAPFLSKDEKHFYFTSSEGDFGQRHFYQMPVKGGKRKRITSLSGNNQVVLSPDETQLAILNSGSNRPWELFLQPNKARAKANQLTESTTEEFQAYAWREPEFIRFPASDGVEVHARLYRPQSTIKPGPAVIFVHGAGYLQNAHKWWSSYYREYMFHNLLVDQGYTVLDIDYRGSAGYGRDCRTGIYRYMGDKDLSDHIDGATLLADKYNVDPERIGIYGGSYGGFITLMALFTQPGVFKAGAALRPVTDWAHYNHGYTASILNTPQTDSIAFVRSSPIYHAEGLEDALLICHGMIDTNVHFQDVVRLTQRLIELGKDQWEVAMFPMEGHGFREASSWADEYRRIFELFERELK
ncbi:MAG: prolyl oligopeptidase family serine peptidase [Bacteroidota bacterium]